MEDNVTIFNDTWASEGKDVNIFTVLSAIKGERWKGKIVALEGLDKDEYTKQKKCLPCVTFSGTFAQRKASGLKKYSNVAVVDLDSLTAEDIDRLRNMLIADKYILSFFISPSRKGLKILVQVSNPPEHHLAAALQLEKYFKEKYNVEADASGKDVSRLCYVSYDRELHLKQAEVFPVTLTESRSVTLGERDPSKGPVTTDIYYIYDVCKKFVEDKVHFVPGQRNRYRHAMACTLNRFGVAMSDAQMLIEVNLPPSDDNAWHQSVRSAYNNRSEHGTVVCYEFEKKETDKVNKVYVEDEESKENLEFINKALVLMRCEVPYRLMRQLLNSGHRHDPNPDEQRVLLVKAHAVFEKEKLETMESEAGALESFDTEIFKAFLGTKNIQFYNSAVDDCLGGFVNGNSYALVGREKAGKSILAIEAAVENAKRGVEVDYFNLEMSLPQFWARVALNITGVDIEEEQKHGTITQAMLQDVMDKVKAVLNGKLIVAGRVGISAKEITLFVNARKAMGFNPQFIIVDGISHLSQPMQGEINSAIENSKLIKQTAIDTDLPVLLLMHTTSAPMRHDRNPIDYVRGAMKVRANLDAWINISVCIDSVKSVLESDPPDIQYLRRTAWLRVHNARGNASTIDRVFKLNERLNFIASPEPPQSFEVNLKPSRR